MNESHVGMVIDNSEDEEDLQFCSTCMAVGEMNKLKERIWLDSKGKRLPDPPDAADWRQCWTCGNIVALRDTKKQGRIAGIQGIEPVDNKFDYGKSTILGNDSKNRYQRLKQRKNKHPDQEVQKLIDQGWELQSYSSSPPI